MRANARRIYIVDDDDAVRDSLSALLESADFEVTGYRSAEEFLAGRNHDSDACLLLDLHMPVMSGMELLEYLQSEGSQLPAIVITGRSDPALRDRALRSGALALFDKPVAEDILLGAIDHAFATAH